MQLIAHQELTSAASSITFSSIPQTFTDLYLLFSARGNASFVNGTVLLNPNGSTANATARTLLGDGSGVGSGTASRIVSRDMPQNNATANTFGNGSFYIPNYTSASNKSISSDAVSENNSTTAIQGIVANLWSNTAAITSLTVASESGSFVANSSFTLYGITAGSDGIVAVS
jgi:hypothetical protein